MNGDTDHRFVEHQHLTTHSYPDSTKLSARRQIYRFAKSDKSLPTWIVANLKEPLGRALDVGCGPGLYMNKVSSLADFVVGVDLSHGMVREAMKESSAVAVADAEHLPFRSESFQTTLCIHMLYHVADIPRAIAELRRVTRMKGQTVVVTNGTDHMKQMRDDFDSTVQRMVDSPGGSVLSGSRRFRIEEAEVFLGATFDDVQRHDLKSTLEVPEPGAIQDYLTSIRSFHEAKLPTEVPWDDVMLEFLNRVRRTIVKDGAYRITTHSGMFICK